MGKIEISPRAEQDIQEVFDFTVSTWGIRQADKYLDLFDNAFQRLLHHPHLGSDYEYGNRDYKKISVGKHVIFYRIIQNGILIVRVLHEKMDIDSRL